MYEYRARITKVYDGDTFTAEIDLGLRVKVTGRLRLARVNTPEVRGPERPEGLRVRDYVRGLILGKAVVISTQKDKKGKYGRWIAEVVYIDTFWKTVNLSEHLVQQGMAREVSY